MGLTAGRYSCPLDRTAHAIRASLLAAAVMTTLIGARCSSASSHGPNGDRSRLTRRTADRAPCTRILRRYLFPRLLMPNSLAFPPVECCRGTSPSQDPNSRPLWKAAPLPIPATIAVATSGPIPGLCLGRWQAGSDEGISLTPSFVYTLCCE